MACQTINPYAEELAKSFEEHTEAQLEAIIAKAEETYENDWSLTIDRLPQTGDKGIYLKQQLKDKLIEHKQ